jgi:spermidine synthase
MEVGVRKWVRLAAVPSPGAELSLWKGGDDYVIRVGTQDLMLSRETGGEVALGELGVAGLRPDARVLIGGLGLGYTLRAALAGVGPRAVVVVAELRPAVVDWNRSLLGREAAVVLEDPRVEIRIGDVRDQFSGPWDAILLDVDNGPEGLSQSENSGLYDETGIWRCRSGLRAGGRLVVWSAGDDPGYTKRLAASGFEVRVERVGAWPGGPRRHWLWIAQKKG